MRTAPTSDAHKSGRSYQGQGPSSGIGVRPMTRFFSSASGQGRLKRLTPTVVATQIKSVQKALYIFTAIGLALSLRAIHRWALLKLPGAKKC